MKRDTQHELRMASLCLGKREQDVIEWMKDPIHNHSGLPIKLESIREARNLIDKLIEKNRGK